MWSRIVCVVAAMTLLASSNPLSEIRRGDYARSRTAPQVLKLLDWNIDRGKRFEKIAAGLLAERPDVALLQEVDLHARRSQFKDVAQELARRMALNFVFAPEFQELGQSSGQEPAYQGQAILTSLRIRSSRMLRFATQSNFWRPRPYLPKWALLQRRAGGRIALIVELDLHGRPLVVYNLHLESRSAGQIQFEQLQEVLKDTERYSKDTAIVIGGDMNTKYPHSVTQVTKLMREAGYQSAFGELRRRTHVIYGSLDWIFVRGPVRLQAAQIHKEIHGSDHFAVSTELAYVTKSASR